MTYLSTDLTTKSIGTHTSRHVLAQWLTDTVRVTSELHCKAPLQAPLVCVYILIDFNEKLFYWEDRTAY